MDHVNRAALPLRSHAIISAATSIGQSPSLPFFAHHICFVRNPQPG